MSFAIYLEAIDDNDSAEGAQQVMGRHSDATLKLLFSLVLCAPASSVTVERIDVKNVFYSRHVFLRFKRFLVLPTFLFLKTFIENTI